MPGPQTDRCPECGARVALRLARGEVCPPCASALAWTPFLEGTKLVIDRAEIDRAQRRRAGELAGEGLARKALRLLPAAAALLLAGAGITFLVRLGRPRGLGPLEAVQGELVRISRIAALLGMVALAVGLLAFLGWRTRPRSLGILAAKLSGILLGTVVAMWGGSRWLLSAHGFGWEHRSMPPLEAAAFTSPWVQSAMEATAVIVGTMEDGDASWPTIGTGAVIAAQRGLVWIVTASHVAMPYAAVGGWRDASRALPVWVYLSDRRSLEGRVCWTGPPPLDVAVVEVLLADPPRPIAISPDSDFLHQGADVFFVPNPFRAGWKVHRGSVLSRERHLTPAGEYSLLYTDLPVQPGDSGSSLYDGQGRLVGLNTWLRQEPGKSQGISLPSESMRSILDRIRRNDLQGPDPPFPGGGGR